MYSTQSTPREGARREPSDSEASDERATEQDVGVLCCFVSALLSFRLVTFFATFFGLPFTFSLSFSFSFLPLYHISFHIFACVMWFVLCCVVCCVVVFYGLCCCVLFCFVLCCFVLCCVVLCCCVYIYYSPLKKTITYTQPKSIHSQQIFYEAHFLHAVFFLVLGVFRFAFWITSAGCYILAKISQKTSLKIAF